MFKKLIFAASLAALAGCSSSGSSSDSTDADAPATPPVTTPPVTTPPVTTPPVTTPPATPTDPTASANPSGAISGVWFGNTNFGEGVFVIDSSSALVGLSSNNGSFEAVHGTTAGGARFLHRDSDNPAHGDSFTLVGDLPSVVDPAQPDDVVYGLSVVNDGEQLDNVGAAGNFSLTFATTNDIEAIDSDFLTGTWRALTSFAPTNADLELNVTFAANGGVTGFTNFDNGTDQFVIPFEAGGQTSVPSDSSLYMGIAFTWNTSEDHTGVVYRDRNDSSRIILNTLAPDNNSNFTAILTRQ